MDGKRIYFPIAMHLKGILKTDADIAIAFCISSSALAESHRKK